MDTTGTQDTDLEIAIAELLRLIDAPRRSLGEIDESFLADNIPASHFDKLLADGWRHFGEHFYRYDIGASGGQIYHVLPLRVRLSEFRLSRSQRRNLKRNSDLAVMVRPIEIDDEIESLFSRHSERFAVGRPKSVYDFLSDRPASVPVEALIVEARENGRLVAASFLDVGSTSTSSMYGMFDPECSSRGLGIFTMLAEIEFSRETGREFYYPGYAYHEPSFYDYKKRFSGLETFDWKGTWAPTPRS